MCTRVGKYGDMASAVGAGIDLCILFLLRHPSRCSGCLRSGRLSSAVGMATVQVEVCAMLTVAALQMIALRPKLTRCRPVLCFGWRRHSVRHVLFRDNSGAGEGSLVSSWHTVRREQRTDRCCLLLQRWICTESPVLFSANHSDLILGLSKVRGCTTARRHFAG